MPDAKKEQRTKDIDGAMEMVGYAPEVIAAKELAMAKGLGGGKKATAALAGRQTIKKIAAPLEALTYAIESLRLASSEDLRNQRVDEASESAKKGAGGRLWDSFSNPIGTIYAAGQMVADTAETNAGQIERAAEYEMEKQRLASEAARKKKTRLEAATKVDPFDRQYDLVPQEVRVADEKQIGLSMVRSYLETNGLA